MKYRAMVKGLWISPECETRNMAAAYVADHHGVSDIECEEETARYEGQYRSWEVSDASGDEFKLLGYVVEI